MTHHHPSSRVPLISVSERSQAALDALSTLLSEHCPWLQVVDTLFFPRPCLIVKDTSNLGIHVAFHDEQELHLYLSVVGRGTGTGEGTQQEKGGNAQ